MRTAKLGFGFKLFEQSWQRAARRRNPGLPKNFATHMIPERPAVNWPGFSVPVDVDVNVGCAIGGMEEIAPRAARACRVGFPGTVARPASGGKNVPQGRSSCNGAPPAASRVCRAPYLLHWRLTSHHCVQLRDALADVGRWQCH